MVQPQRSQFGEQRQSIDFRSGKCRCPTLAPRCLVLCDGELCSREQIRITGSDGKWEFDAVQVAAQEIPPLLDPPAGVRRTWLEARLGKFEFVLLLFYRGRW